MHAAGESCKGDSDNKRDRGGIHRQCSHLTDDVFALCAPRDECSHLSCGEQTRMSDLPFVLKWMIHSKDKHVTMVVSLVIGEKGVGGEELGNLPTHRAALAI